MTDTSKVRNFRINFWSLGKSKSKYSWNSIWDKNIIFLFGRKTEIQPIFITPLFTIVHRDCEHLWSKTFFAPSFGSFQNNWLGAPIRVSDQLFSGPMDILLQKAFSAPSFGRYRKQLIASPYMSTLLENNLFMRKALETGIC